MSATSRRTSISRRWNGRLERRGWISWGRVDQSYFLTGLAFGSGRSFEGESPRDLQRRLTLKTLLMPGGMGSTHKVLIFGRGMGTPALKGLSFSKRLT